MFTNLGRFFSGGNRSLEAGAGGALVLALVDAPAGASYEVEASATINEEPLMNVVGMIPGRRSDEFVLFSAHYDHIGIRPPVDGDSIANGANDDASGTTAVVTLARYFAERGTPERTLLFAAFTAEEGGGYGSRHFSTQLDPDQIVAMFNIEMIRQARRRRAEHHVAHGLRAVELWGATSGGCGRYRVLLLPGSVPGAEPVLPLRQRDAREAQGTRALDLDHTDRCRW